MLFVNVDMYMERTVQIFWYDDLYMCTCFPESHSLRAAFLGSSHALPAAPVPFPKLRWAVTGHCPPDRSPALTAAMKAWVRHHHVVTTQRVHLHALVVQCSGRGDTCGGLGDRLKVRSSQ